MDDQVNKLVEKTWDRYHATPKSQRLLIGIAGIPGSGKTTLAATVVNALNDKFKRASPGATAGQSQPMATFVPMDGYHLTRQQLSAMPDPVNAHARRGASFTFDDVGFFNLIKVLREPITPESKTIYAPSFDHAVKDPVENDIKISTHVRVLVFEGNYIALDKEMWNRAAELMDEVWFVQVDEHVARKRLIARHMAAGLAANEDEAGKRADENDLVNGREINEKRLDVDEIITSNEDASWAPHEQGLDTEGEKEHSDTNGHANGVH